MFKRFKRAMRSFFGFFVTSIEDPEMILEQNIRDLNDQVPKMNESIAMVKANVTLLEKENQKYKNDSVDLTSKVKAALQAGREDIATTYATQLQTLRGAKWQSKVADAMESFQVAGIDATHDEMLQKIQETTAVNEARMDMALSNVDTQGLKIEEEAEKIRAGELLKQFKQEMGLEAPAETGGGDKTLGKKVGVQ